MAEVGPHVAPAVPVEAYTGETVTIYKSHNDDTLLVISLSFLEFHIFGYSIRTPWSNVLGFTTDTIRPCLILHDDPQVLNGVLFADAHGIGARRIPLFYFDYPHNDALVRDLQRHAPWLWSGSPQTSE